MRILLTNDDGIHATGIGCLRRALESEHEVFVVAPEKEQSAMSHAITMHKPLHARDMDYERARGWSVNGTPADCAKLALEALLEEPPDLLLSGINHGANLGRDVFYSGTVSAAMEGMFLGVPSIALSYNGKDATGLQWAADFVAWWIVSEHFTLPPRGILYNVNFPNLATGIPSTLMRVGLGRREYNNDFHRRMDPRGKEYYWLAGKPFDDVRDPHTDVGALSGGIITLTALDMDVVAANFSAMDRIDLPSTFA
jgi:5'-nucleotidase